MDKTKKVENPSLIKPKKKVKIYDFRRPDKFSKDQIRTISMIHETFARLSTTTLSALLKIVTDIRVALVDQLTYNEFNHSIPDPTTLAVIDLPPLNGRAVLEIDPDITFAIMERVFGGNPDRKQNLTREITEIESAIIEHVIIKLLKNIAGAWSNIIDLKPRLDRIEINPKFTQVVPPSDMIVLITFQAKIGSAVGMINLCLPYITIEPVIPKLSGIYWYSMVRKAPKGFINIKKTGELKIDSKIFIQSEKLSLKKISKLEKNSLIKLPEYKKGVTYLESGNKVVLKLKQPQEKIGKAYEFQSFIEDKKNDWEYIQKKVQDQTNQNAIHEAMKEPLEKVSIQFNQIIQEFNSAIKDIKSKQDDMIDQISFTLQSDVDNLQSETIRKQTKPFDSISETHPDHLTAFIQGEHPQLIALILNYLTPTKSSAILSLLPENLQIDVVRRMASIEPTSPLILKDIEKVLNKKILNATKEENYSGSGIDNVAETLNMVDRNTERIILSSLEKTDPEMAEEIKKRMFVFEDIVLLTDTSIKKVLNNCEQEDLILALKIVNGDVKNKIYKNLSQGTAKEIEKTIKKMEPIRLKKIEKAQQSIVGIIRILEEQGEIDVARHDEKIIS